MIEEFLRKCIKILIVSTTRLYGLWPHRFDGKATSVIFFIYSLAFSFASLILFYVYFLRITSQTKSRLRSSVFLLINEWWRHLIGILYITMYGGIYLNHRKILRFLTNVSRVYASSIRTGVRYRQVLFKFLLKSIIFDLFSSLVVIGGPLHSSTSPYANFFGAIAIGLPPIVIRVMPNLYYGCVMGGQLCYRNINNRIESLTSRIERKVFVVGNICVELDALSVEHFRLTNLMNECNELCSVPLVVYIIHQAIGLFAQIILQLYLLRLFGYETLADYHLINILLFAMALLELYETFAVCDHMLIEVNLTSTLLHSMLYEGPNLDQQIRRSAQEFTTQILLHKPSLTGCGMFEFRLSTFQAAIAAIISHAFVLIQFEFSYSYN